jgi:rhodanese-related sulfurtransferase
MATVARSLVVLESTLFKRGADVASRTGGELTACVRNGAGVKTLKGVRTTSATLGWGSKSSARQISLRASSGQTTSIRSVPVQVARELVEAGHRYLDVRTPEEFEAGHIEGAINIPFMYRQNGGMTKNPEFLHNVVEEFDKNDEMVVGCQSGKRSSLAVTELQNVGFACVTDMGGGYGAWLESGLPTTKP